MAYADHRDIRQNRDEMRGTASFLVRAWFAILGLGCLVAVPGLWVSGAGAALPEIGLVKLGLSAFLGLAGLAGVGFARKGR